MVTLTLCVGHGSSNHQSNTGNLSASLEKSLPASRVFVLVFACSCILAVFAANCVLPSSTPYLVPSFRLRFGMCHMGCASSQTLAPARALSLCLGLGMPLTAPAWPKFPGCSTWPIRGCLLWALVVPEEEQRSSAGYAGLTGCRSDRSMWHCGLVQLCYHVSLQAAPRKAIFENSVQHPEASTCVAWRPCHSLHLACGSLLGSHKQGMRLDRRQCMAACSFEPPT